MLCTRGPSKVQKIEILLGNDSFLVRPLLGKVSGCRVLSFVSSQKLLKSSVKIAKAFFLNLLFPKILPPPASLYPLKIL